MQDFKTFRLRSKWNEKYHRVFKYIQKHLQTNILFFCASFSVLSPKHSCVLIFLTFYASSECVVEITGMVSGHKSARTNIDNWYNGIRMVLSVLYYKKESPIFCNYYYLIV